jgi:hypothetical protein
MDEAEDGLTRFVVDGANAQTGADRSIYWDTKLSGFGHRWRARCLRPS